MTNYAASLIPLSCSFRMVFHSHTHKGQEAGTEAVAVLALLAVEYQPAAACVTLG